MSRVTTSAATPENGKKRNARATLKIVCAFAICRCTSGEVARTRSANGPMNGKKIATPTILKAACAAATRRASAFWPTAAITAVAAVPTLAPKMIGIAPTSGMSPEDASDRARPMTAALERTSAVNTAEIRTSRSGWSVRAPSRSANSAFVASGAVPSWMSFMPRNRNPKPRIACPT